ncbi:MAG: PAS domain S-box protein, partial [Brevinematales bacterium]
MLRKIVDYKNVEPGQDPARLLINEMNSPYVLCEIIRDNDNKPADFMFLDFNPAFVSMAAPDTGSLDGKSLLKSGSAAGPFLMRVFQKAAAGYKSKSFEIFSDTLLKHFQIKASRPGKGILAVLFTDITASKKAETERKAAAGLISGYARDVTDRKFQESRLWLQAQLLDSATDSILLLDLEGNIAYANQIFYETRGYTKEEILKMNIRDIDDPESSKRIMENIKNTISNGSACFEAVNLRKDGMPIFIEVSVRLINFENREYLLSINHDISDRKLAEEKLRKSELELKTLVENVPDIIARFDRNLKHIFINKALMADTGIDPQTLIGKGFENFGKLPPEYTVNAEDFLRTIFEKGEVVNFETYIPSKTGNEYYLSKGMPEYGPDGSIESALVIHRNITRRKKAEDALWESEIRFETMFRDSPIATTLTRISDNKYVEVNGVFLWQFGYNRNEVIGKTIFDLGLWENIKAWEKMIGILEEKSRVDNFETLFLTKEGKPLNVIINAEIVKVSGEPYILGTAIDISERKISEERIRQSLSEKEVLLRELYHRTKNNMQVISAMLNMYSSGSQDQYLINAFLEMVNRIQSMALVHQKLYQSKNLSSISLKDYIIDLVNLLS